MALDNYVYITEPNAKSIPNCDVSFTNGKLHQAMWSRDTADEHVTKILS